MFQSVANEPSIIIFTAANPPRFRGFRLADIIYIVQLPLAVRWVRVAEPFQLSDFLNIVRGSQGVEVSMQLKQGQLEEFACDLLRLRLKPWMAQTPPTVASHGPGLPSRMLQMTVGIRVIHVKHTPTLRFLYRKE